MSLASRPPHVITPAHDVGVSAPLALGFKTAVTGRAPQALIMSPWGTSPGPAVSLQVTPPVHFHNPPLTPTVASHFAHSLSAPHTPPPVLGFLTFPHLCTLWVLSPVLLSTFTTHLSLMPLTLNYPLFHSQCVSHSLGLVTFPLGGPCRCSGHFVGRGRWSYGACSLPQPRGRVRVPGPTLHHNVWDIIHPCIFCEYIKTYLHFLVSIFPHFY